MTLLVLCRYYYPPSQLLLYHWVLLFPDLIGLMMTTTPMVFIQTSMSLKKTRTGLEKMSLKDTPPMKMIIKDSPEMFQTGLKMMTKKKKISEFLSDRLRHLPQPCIWSRSSGKWHQPLMALEGWNNFSNYFGSCCMCLFQFKAKLFILTWWQQ